jgi:hypothetical protein
MEHIEDGFRLGRWVVKQRYRALEHRDRAARLEALPGWEWNTKEGGWGGGLSALKRYVAREGHSRVPQAHVEDGFTLGRWAAKQRSAHRAGRLSRERRTRLESLPQWIWDPHAARWDDAYQRLRLFAEREGDAQVPQQHIEDGFRLGQWANSQRTARQAGRLSKERVARLESVPGWKWRESEEESWERGFSHLQLFVEREEHARVPLGHPEDSFALGGWVALQRNRYRAGRLDADRVRRLEELPGWVWNPHKAAWEKAYSRVEAFLTREGHALVGVQYVDDDGFKLGQWVSNQRTAYKAGRLPETRVARLEALPGWAWDAYQGDRQVSVPPSGALGT